VGASAPQARGPLSRLRRANRASRGSLNANGRQQIRHFAVVVIRPAKLSDAASLAAIAERTFRETFAADNSAENINLHCAQNFSAQIQREEISDPQLGTLLADIAGELVGFAQLRLAHATACVKGDRPAELHRIYVSGKWHSRGVANELMRAVYAAAAKAGSDCLWLGVWERNLKAIAFYRKCEFSVVGDHVFMLGHDPQRDLILVAQLGSVSSVA
jgi:ribosomal protein S18 acetylase RimI-like enzyme